MCPVQGKGRECRTYPYLLRVVSCEYFLPTFKKHGVVPAMAEEVLNKDLIDGHMSPKASWLQRRLAKVIILAIWKGRNKRSFRP